MIFILIAFSNWHKCSETDYYKYSYDIGNGGGTEGTDEEPVVKIYIDE